MLVRFLPRDLPKRQLRGKKVQFENHLRLSLLPLANSIHSRSSTSKEVLTLIHVRYNFLLVTE